MENKIEFTVFVELTNLFNDFVASCLEVTQKQISEVSVDNNPLKLYTNLVNKYAFKAYQILDRYKEQNKRRN